jgi:hypothetical protein
MKGRLSVVLHLAALLLAAICTYLVFSGDKTKQAKLGKVILDTKPSRLKLLSYDTGRKTVAVSPRKGGGYTLKITEMLRKPAPKKPKPASTDGGVPDGTEEKKAEPAPLVTETKVTSYRASREFDKTLEKLLPLHAKRDLGQIDKEKLEKFGLTKSERNLTVESAGQRIDYTVGNQAYGGATTYLRQQPQGPVYLISSSMLRSIDVRSPRYMERRLIKLDKKDVEKVQVSVLTKSRVLKQLHTKPRKWIAEDSPESQNDLFDNWANNFFRMGAAEYMKDDKLPPLTTVASLLIIKHDKPIDTVELASTGEEEGKSEFFARSQHTGQWVKLRRADAEGVVSDLPTILEQ